MTEFNELYLALMGEAGGNGNLFDDWNLKSIGLKRDKYVASPKKVPLSHAPQPEIVECPKCGYKFHCNKPE